MSIEAWFKCASCQNWRESSHGSCSHCQGPSPAVMVDLLTRMKYARLHPGPALATMRRQMQEERANGDA